MVRQALLRVVEHDRGPVVVDLSEVPFMDSSGVHVLVDAHQRLEFQNRRLVIACPAHSQVHRLLALSGLLAAVRVHGSRDTAVSATMEVDPAGPTIALAMARRREPAGPTSARARQVG
jgi:anti-anti-sigma factor